ncbi:MAG: FAD:protein FMN transferase [Planctomycetes bacterium]|nr:FAD:protein FMN transferase [Planctomycetota bacterium]
MRALASLATAYLAIALAGGCKTPGEGGDGGPSDVTVYMTEEEALRTLLPAAGRVVEERAVLTAEERRAVEDLVGERVGERAFAVRAGVRADGTLDGYAVVHSEVGKFKPFDFAAGIEPDGSVRRVVVLVYREARGAEIAGRRFLVQYAGKTASDPISIQRDIIHVSGATMSVNALNLGVKKALAVVEVLYRRHPERVARLLAQPGRPLGAGAAVGAPRAGHAPLEEVREARYVMGALCEVRAWGEGRERLRAAVARAFEEIETADELLSDWRPESELSRASREASRAPVAVSRLTAEFLDLAARISRESGGALDITVGPAIQAWGLRGGPARVPTGAELEALREVTGPEKVTVAAREGGGFEVRLARDGMRLDPGALGKGFAVDLAARRLREEGVSAALVDFSGNMYAFGAPPGEEGWRVAVRDPARPGSVLGLVTLRDGAIASSGSYERSVVAGGKRRGHILSPRTLEPVEGVLGTAVVARTAALADGYSTAAFVLGESGASFLEGRPGVEGLVVLGEEGRPARLLATRGWRLQ